MNKLLERQLRRHFGDQHIIPDELRPFLEAVSAAYDDFEADHQLVERSLELTSREMIGLNETVRRQADTEVHKEKRFTDVLIDALPGILLVIDEDMQLVRWNTNLEHISGYSHEELEHHVPLMMIPPKDRATAREKAQEVFAQGSLIDEFPLYTKDGRIIQLSLNAKRFSSQGKPVMVIIGFDLTQRNKTLEQLRQSEERNRILYESAPDAMFLYDSKGNFIDGNTAGVALVGYAKEELIGKSFLALSLISARELPKAAAALARNVMGQTTGPDEYTLKRKDGSTVPVEIRAIPVALQGKKVMIGIARDISGRRHTEEEIRQRGEDLERFNKLMVGRELKMAELKEEVARLTSQLGQARPGQAADTTKTHG